MSLFRWIIPCPRPVVFMAACPFCRLIASLPPETEHQHCPRAAAAPEGLQEQEPGVSGDSQTLPRGDTMPRVTLALE